MPAALIDGGPGDADVNTNGETDTQELTTQYIDNDNAKQLCHGRWRWTEKWDAGYDQTIVCMTHSVAKTTQVIDININKVPGFPGISASLGTPIVIDLGVSEATTRTTNSKSASTSNNFDILMECNKRKDEWLADFRFKPIIVHEQKLQQLPRYAGIFNSVSIDPTFDRYNMEISEIHGARCTDSKAGICVAFTNKSQCQITFTPRVYQVETRDETEYTVEQVNPSCKAGVVHITDYKYFSGISKLKTTLAQASELTGNFAEATQNKPDKSGFVCSSGVHLKDIKAKYEFLNSYINANKARAGVTEDPEFVAAVATLWALYVEKSDVLATLDVRYIDNIMALHRLFPAAVFLGHSDADLNVDIGLE